MFRVFGYTESVETIEENEMTKLEMKVILLTRLESLAKAWANGDVRQAQKDYDYVRGFCDGANLDFNNVLIGGMQCLLRQCVGILDRAVYSGYLNGFGAGFLADIVDEQVFTTN